MKQTIAKQIKWDFKTNGDLIINDKNGNRIYYETSYRNWGKWEHDSDGNIIYFEDSNGFWGKYEYDSQGNEIYYENSNGTIRDNRPKPCDGKVVEIEGVKYKLTKL
jgi:hypothetical protein